MEVLMKQRIKKCMTDLLKDESGQGTTEYILILVGVVALALMFGGTFKGKLTETVTKLGQSVVDFSIP